MNRLCNLVGVGLALKILSSFNVSASMPEPIEGKRLRTPDFGPDLHLSDRARNEVLDTLGVSSSPVHGNPQEIQGVRTHLSG